TTCSVPDAQRIMKGPGYNCSTTANRQCSSGDQLMAFKAASSAPSLRDTTEIQPLHGGCVDASRAGGAACAGTALRIAREEGPDSGFPQNCAGLCGIMRDEIGVYRV